VHVQAFQWVLEVAQAKGVLRGKVLAIDARRWKPTRR
jgi:hypothetical protein